MLLTLEVDLQMWHFKWSCTIRFKFPSREAISCIHLCSLGQLPDTQLVVRHEESLPQSQARTGSYLCFPAGAKFSFIESCAAKEIRDGQVTREVLKCDALYDGFYIVELRRSRISDASHSLIDKALQVRSIKQAQNPENLFFFIFFINLSLT